MPQRLQSSRYELKYVIPEGVAREVQRCVRGYLILDQYMRPDQPLGYVVNSLYLDSRARVLYSQTVDGIKNRFKLRVRFYDDDPAHPVFVEIKRRVTDVIRKERAAVTREGVQRLLSGQALGERDLFGGAERHGADAKSLDALRNFCDLRNQLAADGAAFVCYVREAYVHPHTDELRVTFDRRIQGRPYRRGAGLSLASPGSPADVPGVVLEIKFTNRFPAWLRQVAQDLGLVRRSLPKYVKCVDALQGPALGGPPGFRAVQARAGSMAR